MSSDPEKTESCQMASAWMGFSCLCRARIGSMFSRFHTCRGEGGGTKGGKRRGQRRERGRERGEVMDGGKKEGRLDGYIEGVREGEVREGKGDTNLHCGV